MRADLVQTFEILRQVQVPQCDRLLPKSHQPASPVSVGHGRGPHRTGRIGRLVSHALVGGLHQQCVRI
jgi:hypothetical protein